MFRKKIITREDGTPYLERTYIVKLKNFQICLHKILQSDEDCLHDHPWNFLSIILDGGYWERTTAEQVLEGPELQWYKMKHKDKLYARWFGVGRVLYRRAEWKHSLKLEKWKPKNHHLNCDLRDIELLKESKILSPATTLVIMFKRKREWGFFTKNGWLPWFKYKSTQSCD
jgi:hypothetical protein